MNRAREVVTEQLKVLRGRVDRWRKHRDGGRSMVPEQYWSAAVEMARVAGVHATSKALGFNYYSLKDRLALADGAASPRKAERGATFVEMQLPSPPSPTARDSGAGGQSFVELVETGGACMRIGITGTSNVDVVGLVQAFWSRER